MNTQKNVSTTTLDSMTLHEDFPRLWDLTVKIMCLRGAMGMPVVDSNDNPVDRAAKFLVEIKRMQGTRPNKSLAPIRRGVSLVTDNMIDSSFKILQDDFQRCHDIMKMHTMTPKTDVNARPLAIPPVLVYKPRRHGKNDSIVTPSTNLQDVKNQLVVTPCLEPTRLCNKLQDVTNKTALVPLPESLPLVHEPQDVDSQCALSAMDASERMFCHEDFPKLLALSTKLKRLRSSMNKAALASSLVGPTRFMEAMTENKYQLMTDKPLVRRGMFPVTDRRLDKLLRIMNEDLQKCQKLCPGKKKKPSKKRLVVKVTKQTKRQPFQKVKVDPVFFVVKGLRHDVHRNDAAILCDLKSESFASPLRDMSVEEPPEINSKDVLDAASMILDLKFAPLPESPSLVDESQDFGRQDVLDAAAILREFKFNSIAPLSKSCVDEPQLVNSSNVVDLKSKSVTTSLPDSSTRDKKQTTMNIMPVSMLRCGMPGRAIKMTKSKKMARVCRLVATVTGVAAFFIATGGT